jgi:hypothetical protein
MASGLYTFRYNIYIIIYIYYIHQTFYLMNNIFILPLSSTIIPNNYYSYLGMSLEFAILTIKKIKFYLYFLPNILYFIESCI